MFKNIFNNFFLNRLYIWLRYMRYYFFDERAFFSLKKNFFFLRFSLACVYNSHKICVYKFAPTIAAHSAVHFHTRNRFSQSLFIRWEEKSRVVIESRGRKKSKSLPNNYIIIFFRVCWFECKIHTIIITKKIIINDVEERSWVTDIFWP